MLLLLTFSSLSYSDDIEVALHIVEDDDVDEVEKKVVEEEEFVLK